ncbi:MAG: isochorismatase family cysteine hydrolase [Pseudomonadota bacterium]
MQPLGPNPKNTWRVSPSAADLTRPAIPSRPLSVPAKPKPVTLDLSRTAFIIIDMQRDFCHPEGWLAGIGVDVSAAAALVPTVGAAADAFRAAGVPVLWVNWGNRDDRANISPALRHVYDNAGEGTGLGDPIGPHGARVLTEGSWSAALMDGLTPAPGDIHVSKYRMSGFYDTPLDAILRNLRVDHLIFAGVNSDQCVLHTLADANFLGFDTLLLEDATGTTSPDFCHEATLYNVRQIFGFTLTFADLQPALESTRV